jgi:hypothetical protein
MVRGLLHKTFAQHSDCADPLIDLFGAKIRVGRDCPGHSIEPSVLSETYLLLLIGGTAAQCPVESPVCIPRLVKPDGAGDRGKRLAVRSQGQYLVVYNGRLGWCRPNLRGLRSGILGDQGLRRRLLNAEGLRRQPGQILSRLAFGRQTTLTALACRPFGPWVVSN